MHEPFTLLLSVYDGDRPDFLEGAFRSAVGQAEAAGARPQLRHLANTPATLTLPDTWFDMVRSGGAVVGLSTLPGGAPDWLRPAMTIRTQLIQVKRVPARTPVPAARRADSAASASEILVTT